MTYPPSRLTQVFSVAIAWLALFVLTTPAPAQYYYHDDWYFDDFNEEPYEDDYYVNPRSVDPESGVRRLLQEPGYWEYEFWGDEYEYEAKSGEIEYDPEGDYLPRPGQTLDDAVRQELAGPGEWEYEPLQGEWEFEGNGEIEFEPGYNWDYDYTTQDWWDEDGLFDRWY